MGESSYMRTTEDCLREAFLELLREKPFDRVRVTEVADRAKVSRKTFYSHYADMNALAFDCYRKHLCVDPDFRVSRYAQPKDLVDAMIAAISENLEFCKGNPAFARLVYQQAFYSRYLSRIPAEGIVAMVSSMEDVQPSPSRVRDELLPYETVAKIYFLSTGFILSDWVENGMVEPVDLVARRAAYLTFHLSDVYSAEDGACSEFKRLVLNRGQ